MVTNMLDYMYEGYGYDMDNQLLYTDVEKYNEALDKDGYTDKGMKTLSSNDWKITGYQEGLPTENANKYKEVPQFVSENGTNYTDLRQQICQCGGNGTYQWAYDCDE